MMEKRIIPVIAQSPKVTVVLVWTSAFVAAMLVAYSSLYKFELAGSFAKQVILGGFWGLLINLITATLLAYSKLVRLGKIGFLAFLMLIFLVVDIQMGHGAGHLRSFISIGVLSNTIFLSSLFVVALINRRR